MNALLLQTTNPVHYVTQDDQKKPLAYKIYEYTKGGIDIYNQRISSYTTKLKTRKWILVALSYVHDMAPINSEAIYVTNNANEDTNNFEFGWELMKALVKPNMQIWLALGNLSIYLHN